MIYKNVLSQMEVVKPPNPIQQIETDRLAVLNSLFPIELPFSSDIRQLILDFVFHRKSCEKTINGDEGSSVFIARFKR